MTGTSIVRVEPQDLIPMLRELHEVFRVKQPTPEILLRQAKIYQTALSGLSLESLRAAAKVAIAEDSFFPKPAQLRQRAVEWSRHRQAHAESDDRLPCRFCGSLPGRPHVSDGHGPFHPDSVWASGANPVTGRLGRG